MKNALSNMTIQRIYQSILLVVSCYSLITIAAPAWAAVTCSVDEAGKVTVAGAPPGNTIYQFPKNIQKQLPSLLPQCTYFEGTNKSKECGCRNISDLVKFLIIYGNFAIGGVGAIALLMFIYGGFVMLTAAGAAEKVQKGKQAIVAAVIGIIIVFSAQLLVKFIIKDALQAQLKDKEKSLEIKPEQTPDQK